MTSESNIVDTLIQQIINRFSESGVYPYVHSSGLHPVNGDSRLYLFQPAAIDGDSADYFVADRSYEYFTAIARHEHAIFYSSNDLNRRQRARLNFRYCQLATESLVSDLVRLSDELESDSNATVIREDGYFFCPDIDTNQVLPEDDLTESIAEIDIDAASYNTEITLAALDPLIDSLTLDLATLFSTQDHGPSVEDTTSASDITTRSESANLSISNLHRGWLRDISNIEETAIGFVEVSSGNDSSDSETDSSSSSV